MSKNTFEPAFTWQQRRLGRLAHVKEQVLATAIQRLERQQGDFSDLEFIEEVRAHPGPTEEKVLYRALAIAQREKLDQRLDQWWHYGFKALRVLAMLAALAGFSLVLSALGTSGQAVNILVALMSLLLFNTFTLVYWLKQTLKTKAQPEHGQLEPGIVVQLLMWMTRRWTKKLSSSDHTLLMQTHIELLTRHKLMPWALGYISHLCWLVTFSVAFISMLVLFLFKQYAFVFESTLMHQALTPIVQVLSVLPHWLGFPYPDADMIAQSMHTASGQTLDRSLQSQWAWWLLGIVLVYGMIPRGLAFVVSSWRLRQGVAQIAIREIDQPLLFKRLEAVKAQAVPKIDIPWAEQLEPSQSESITDTKQTKQLAQSGHWLLVGIELSQALQWEQQAKELVQAAKNSPHLAELSLDAERNLVEHQELQALVRTLQQELLNKKSSVVLVCDGYQTPSRGTLYDILELARAGRYAAIIILAAEQEASVLKQERVALWQDKLQEIGFDASNIHVATHLALDTFQQVIAQAIEQGE